MTIDFILTLHCIYEWKCRSAWTNQPTIFLTARTLKSQFKIAFLLFTCRSTLDFFSSLFLKAGEIIPCHTKYFEPLDFKWPNADFLSRLKWQYLCISLAIPEKANFGFLGSRSFNLFYLLTHTYLHLLGPLDLSLAFIGIIRLKMGLPLPTCSVSKGRWEKVLQRKVPF